MEPGGDPFKFMVEIDRLAADLHRLGDKSVTELRKCVIIVSGLSADFEMECRMLEDNLAGLNRAEIGRVVGNRTADFSGSYITRRHCRHRRAPLRRIAGTGRTGDPALNSMETASIAERRVTALETAGARKRVKSTEQPTTRRRAVAAVGATSAGVRSTLRKGTVVCARALSIERETVRSAELKKEHCWQN